MKPLLAIDLCCGAGGWACAARGLPIRIVAAVDYWDVACQTYRLNHPKTEVVCADLRTSEMQHDIGRWKPVDLVLGGIPCEWLSIRRNVGNAPEPEELAQERATLAAVLGLVERLAPRYWCLEDVKGLVPELPAGTPWIELNAADYSAQTRRRVYVGRFPRPGGIGPLATPVCPRTLGDALRPGPYRVGRRTFGRTPTTNNTFAKDKCYARPASDKAGTVCSFGGRHDPECVVLDPSVPGGMRQMEWQEAAALQGFPLDYLFYGSATDVWTQVGRAVQIDIARVILEAIVADAEAKQ